jgi:exodeoxyribonuclease V alpha subunit
MANTYQMDMKVKRIVSYSEERGSGIFGCEPVHYNQELIRNKYKNVALRGRARPLVEGEVYTIQFEGDYTDDYGVYYNIIDVETEKLDTIESQNRFLKAILSPTQFETLQKAYPNEKLVDLIVANQIDTSKTKGIKEKTLDKIKDKIHTNDSLSVVIAGSEGMGFTMNQLHKINDHYKDAAKALHIIQTNIYELCRIDTFGFLTIDKVAMERGDNPYNSNRINSAISYAIQKELDNGHTWIKRGDLLDKLVKLLDLQMDSLIGYVNDLAKNDYYYANDNRITFKFVYEQEKAVLEELKRIAYAYKPNVNEHDLHFRIKQVEAEQGFAFTDEQYQVIVEGNEHGVMVVNGKGGVGKTTLMSGIIKVYEYTNYITVALSGKAAQVLALKGIESSTIHRAIGVNQNPDIKVQMEYDLVIGDEFSMVDVPLVLQLLQAIKSGSKLVISGDSGQLPAIGYGDVLRDLLTTDLFPSYELTKVHRQAAKSGILSLANDIRDGKQIMKYNIKNTTTETYGELQDQTVIAYSSDTKGNIVHDILNIATAYKKKIIVPKDLFDFQVIVTNKDKKDLSVANLNMEMQKIFNPAESDSIVHRNQTFKINDKVIHKGNSYDISVFYSFEQFIRHIKEDEKTPLTTVYNGTMGIIGDVIVSDELEGVLVRFEGQVGDVFIEKKELDKIQLAYALTVHSSQGSGIKHVVFALDYGAFTLLSRQLVYTALTRAIEKGVALVEGNALHRAVTIDASGIRKTFLRDMINTELANDEVK